LIDLLRLNLFLLLHNIPNYAILILTFKLLDNNFQNPFLCIKLRHAKVIFLTTLINQKHHLLQPDLLTRLSNILILAVKDIILKVLGPWRVIPNVHTIPLLLVFSGLDVEEEADELFGVGQSVVLHELAVRGEGGGDHKTLDITLIIVFNTELNLLFPIQWLVLGAS
jgi:hypothetical protein